MKLPMKLSMFNHLVYLNEKKETAKISASELIEYNSLCVAYNLDDEKIKKMHWERVRSNYEALDTLALVFYYLIFCYWINSKAGKE